MKKIDLLVIDPQVDFCDPSVGTLVVPNAMDDMKRLAKMLKKGKNKIDAVRCTLDSHRTVDVAHPVFWKDKNGNNPNPFTIISSTDIKNGTWRPFHHSLNQRMLDYVETLEKNGKYLLCIWPTHCLIGHPGSNVVHDLMESFIEWEKTNHRNVDYVTKGSNPFTEHYGAIKAEVPDPQDSTTHINTDLINELIQADIIAIAGEAGSHCVKESVLQVVENLGSDDYIKKIVLLTDAMSPVIHPAIDFPAIQNQFIQDMVARGMQVSTTVDFL